MYTDVLLIAHLQRMFLDRLCNEFAELPPQSRSWSDVEDFSDRWSEFRNRYWWPDIAVATHAAHLLQGTQNQLRTAEIFDRLASDVREHRDLVGVRQLADLNKRQAEMVTDQEANADADRQFERTAKVFASVAVAVSLMLALLGVDIYDGEWIGWLDQGRSGVPLWSVFALMIVTGGVAFLVSRHLVNRRR